MDRVMRGFRLARASLEVLVGDTGLLLLPVIAFVMIAAVAGVYLGLLWSLGLTAHLSYVALIPLYFVASVVSIFATAAVVATADLYLQGGHP
jgi:hypothetical protein